MCETSICKCWFTGAGWAGTRGYHAVPVPSSWSVPCAQWCNQVAQSVALPSPGVWIFLVTWCRRELCSSFKAWSSLPESTCSWVPSPEQSRNVVILNHPLLKHNSAKEFVGWNGKSKQHLGAKRRSENSFKKRKGGKAPQPSSLPCDCEYMQAKLRCYKGGRNR